MITQRNDRPPQRCDTRPNQANQALRRHSFPGHVARVRERARGPLGRVAQASVMAGKVLVTSSEAAGIGSGRISRIRSWSCRVIASCDWPASTTR